MLAPRRRTRWVPGPLLSLLGILALTACVTTGMEGDLAGDTRPTPWGDRYWGPSVEPLPDSFLPSERALPQTGWERVAEWTGDDSRRTQLFSVDSEWQIVWRSGPRSPEMPLTIKAFAIPDNILVANLSQAGESQEIALHLRGGGTFYLEVTGDGGPWHVAIEIPRPDGAR